MKSSLIVEGILSLLFITQVLAVHDYEYGIWRAGHGCWCPKATCCSYAPSPYYPSKTTCCTTVPNAIAGCGCCCLPDCSCGGSCCPYQLAKTTTCTTVPHSSPLCAKTTTCTTVPHSVVCGKTTTCTTVPHGTSCCGKTTACTTTLPHYLQPSSLIEPCAKTSCTTVPTPCGPKTTCCTTVPSYIQLPYGHIACGNPPIGCCSWC